MLIRQVKGKMPRFPALHPIRRCPQLCRRQPGGVPSALERSHEVMFPARGGTVTASLSLRDDAQVHGQPEVGMVTQVSVHGSRGRDSSDRCDHHRVRRTAHGFRGRSPCSPLCLVRLRCRC